MAGWMIEATVGGTDLKDDKVEEKEGVNGGGVDAAEEGTDGASDFCGAVGDRRQEIEGLGCKALVAIREQ